MRSAPVGVVGQRQLLSVTVTVASGISCRLLCGPASIPDGVVVFLYSSSSICIFGLCIPSTLPLSES